MGVGVAATNQLVNERTIERAEEIYDQAQEGMAMADELGNALSQPLGEIEDEDELLGELEDLENEEMNARLNVNDRVKPLQQAEPQHEQLPEFPEPGQNPIVSQSEEDAELAALEAEFA